jgi:hypothetical protein
MRTRVNSGFRRFRLPWLALAAGLFPAAVMAGDFVVAPTDLEFGIVFVGEASSIAVVIVNASNVPQTPDFAGGAPFDPDNFGGSQNCAGVTLPPGGSCAFTYEFHPVSAGPKNSSTTIGINGVNYPITMAGIGLFPIAVGPLFLDFGNVVVGATRTKAVFFTNVSEVPQAPGFAGGAPFDPDNFGGSQNCAGVTLPPGGSCAFTYEFHPVSLGPITSFTTIGVDGENFDVTLIGVGGGGVKLADRLRKRDCVVRPPGVVKQLENNK